MLIKILGAGEFEILGRGVSPGQSVVLYFSLDQDGPRERVVVTFADEGGRLAGYFSNEFPHQKAIGQAVPVQTQKH